MKKLLLSVSVLFAVTANSQDCSELFISEYIEGPGNNNAIEIYNPTNNPIDLSGYTINRYGNGATSSPDVWPLSGTLNTGEAIAIGNGQIDSIWVSSYWSLPVDASFYAACGINGSGVYPTPFYFNGDDAMTLEKGGDIVDIFGKVGEDPGNAWTDDVTAGYTDANGGTWWTKRQTLVRKSSVKSGVTQNPILFNPASEYDSLPDATYSAMGTHTCECTPILSIENTVVSYVMYPNPTNRGQTVSINSKENITFLEVYNILGEKIVREKSSNISTKNLLRGNYLIKIYFENGTTVTNTLIVE